MNKFSEYATSAAFSITLSKPMIESLASFRWGKYRDKIYEHGSYMMSIAALERRGLLQRSDRRIGMTPEGKLILDLCGMAGLLDEQYMDERWPDDIMYEPETLQKVPVV